MTRKEAIKILKELAVWTEQHGKTRKAIDMALEALEQEPILDKIRAELHLTAEMHEDGDYYLRDEWIDEYFDRYKAENNLPLCEEVIHGDFTGVMDKE